MLFIAAISSSTSLHTFVPVALVPVISTSTTASSSGFYSSTCNVSSCTTTTTGMEVHCRAAFLALASSTTAVTTTTTLPYRSITTRTTITASSLRHQGDMLACCSSQRFRAQHHYIHSYLQHWSLLFLLLRQPIPAASTAVPATRLPVLQQHYRKQTSCSINVVYAILVVGERLCLDFGATSIDRVGLALRAVQFVPCAVLRIHLIFLPLY